MCLVKVPFAWETEIAKRVYSQTQVIDGFLLFVKLITKQYLILCELINILDQTFILEKIQDEMSDIMASTFAAHLNASACRYSILPSCQPKANDPIFFSTPSFLILSAIYFYYKYDCDKTGFLACRCLFRRGLKARNKEKKSSNRPA